MAINTEERRYEEERLAKTRSVINCLLSEKKAFFARLKEEVRKDRKTMWEEGHHVVDSFASAVNFAQQLNNLRYTELAAINNQRTIRKLEKMLDSPYFARIDFHEQGTPAAEAIYIGISSLPDPEGKPLIYDWRAPVSSMFYDYELGPAQYRCEAGVISGEIQLKRQYKIEHGRLVYLFDCNLKIDDEILQEILSKHSDEKMRSIVTSIQREQNRVIRDDDHPVLLVQGAAGSGKTSVALHRAAYYLYKERDRITSKNILIFSPNHLFADYIANVLPELGEEMVRCTTFQDLAARFLPPGLSVEDRHNQLEFVLTASGSPEDSLRTEKIYLQSTPEFLQLIDDYQQYITRQGKPFPDLRFEGELILSKEELRKLYDQYYAYLPMKKRLVQLQRRAFYLLRPLTKRKVKEYTQKITREGEPLAEKEIMARSRLALRKELLPLRAAIHSWTAIDCYQLYRELFANQELLTKIAAGRFPPAVLERLRRAVLKTLDAKILAYEDLAPFLYFRGKIEGFPRFSQIKHIIIDEAQDYTLFHYQIIKEMFPAATFTILGDSNQAIHPRQYRSSFEEIRKLFAAQNPILLSLNKSYRSTGEITVFTLQLLGETVTSKTEYINRPGPKPVIVKVTDPSVLVPALTEQLRSLVAEGFSSLAVITKTACEAQRVYEALKKVIPVRLITKEEKTFSNGPLIIPSYLAKGLEFDAVLIADCSRETYGQAEELPLFYTVCTRALHRLFLYYTGEPSPFLAKVNPELYSQATYPKQRSECDG
ncbi:MAG: AAA family ATPase [Firmicutes bacterium]|nr:AAA family ATPase [Bacillota bacterium]